MCICVDTVLHARIQTGVESMTEGTADAIMIDRGPRFEERLTAAEREVLKTTMIRACLFGYMSTTALAILNGLVGA